MGQSSPKGHYIAGLIAVLVEVGAYVMNPYLPVGPWFTVVLSVVFLAALVLLALNYNKPMVCLRRFIPRGVRQRWSSFILLIVGIPVIAASGYYCHIFEQFLWSTGRFGPHQSAEFIVPALYLSVNSACFIIAVFLYVKLSRRPPNAKDLYIECDMEALNVIEYIQNSTEFGRGKSEREIAHALTQEAEIGSLQVWAYLKSPLARYTFTHSYFDYEFNGIMIYDTLSGKPTTGVGFCRYQIMKVWPVSSNTKKEGAL